MNPPTDAGKKDLPPGLRSRFTEFFVDELSSKDDLQVLAAAYLRGVTSSPPVADIVSFYLQARQAAATVLLDGANQKPHYSLRTLTRALDFARSVSREYGFQRALYEGFSMSFLTQLNNASLARMEALIVKSFGGNGSLKQLLRLPKSPGAEWTAFESFWLQNGPEKPADMPQYILTESIKRHLNNLARIVVSRRHPVLLQGPTSAGKTSMVEYLARRTGHRFVRINNHEHTDLQEYLGTYQANTEGKLVFEEGVLVQAVRNGHWVVLDELNLAPSEVLEALNRLLDDNRELFIPETQETVRPHPHFMLFATQNPPGLYGGRKVLSRAFRNRFIELHIDDIPEPEVEVILEKRCELPPSYAKKLVAIMVELQRHRQSSKVFAGKHGFVTLRDLFRWAHRRPNGYQELANEGYMLLAERLRREDEKQLVKSTLEKHLKVSIDTASLYGPERIPPQLSAEHTGIVWTASMRRMFVLLGRCLESREPVLLVGETGCGKTSVCQLYALLRQQRLHTLNCHQNTETADLLGGLRPVRGREPLVARYRELAQQLLAALHT
jgi:midasin (ATPase involved in ribosome maturation)